jgi:hypothetical protein
MSILLNVFIVRGTFAWLGRQVPEPGAIKSVNSRACAHGSLKSKHRISIAIAG